jgi:ferric-dicitrate binding protein FerR (iron transport regulator)
MRPTEHQSAEMHARALGELLGQAAEEYAAEHPLPTADSLLERAWSGLAPRPAWQRTAWRISGALAAAAAVVLLSLWLLRAFSPAPLGYEAKGASETEQGTFAAPRVTPARLEFSDGSAVVLNSGAQVQVRETTPRGATLVLDRGVTTSEIVHQPDTQWSLLAGTFTVRVVGTRFVTEWAPTSGQLRVEVLEGSVSVEGGPLSTQSVVRAGQRFHADARSGAWGVEALHESGEADAEPSANHAEVGTSAPVASSGAPGDVLEAEPPAASSATARPASAPSWADLMARGDFKAIVSEAKRRGIDSCLTGCSPADVRRLADAARYTGELALAERALVALRGRSPGSAAVASYLLGTLNESRGRSGAALRWYETYLREAPGGQFQADALLGRMRLSAATGRQQAARQAARQYLAAHPNGVGAAAARGILNKP